MQGPETQSAKLGEEWILSPRRMGATIGHFCAYGGWLIEALDELLECPGLNVDESKLTQKAVKAGARITLEIVND